MINGFLPASTSNKNGQIAKAKTQSLRFRRRQYLQFFSSLLGQQVYGNLLHTTSHTFATAATFVRGDWLLRFRDVLASLALSPSTMVSPILAMLAFVTPIFSRPNWKELAKVPIALVKHSIIMEGVICWKQKDKLA